MTESPEQWFHRRATHYVEAQILFHLNRMGVFSLLEKRGSMSVDELAEALSLVPNILGTCLDYVEGVDDLIESDDLGRYRFTKFGRAVLSRYGRDVGSEKKFNFFDVRVGGYGPIWNELDSLLRGELQYGETLQRHGDRAAEAVYVVGSRLIESLHMTIQSIGGRSVVEIGVSTGLLSLLKQRDAELQALGIDRSKEALSLASTRAKVSGVQDIEWQQADFFIPAEWNESLVPLDAPMVLFSVHFHELLAKGLDRAQEVLRQLGRARPGLRILAMEQPRPEMRDRAAMTDSSWLYSQSNVLIHHLIGNGKILSVAEWNEFFVGAGGTIESREEMNFLGYEMWVVRF